MKIKIFLLSRLLVSNYRFVCRMVTLCVFQGYERPLRRLEENEQVPKVIWTDDLMSLYVPVLIKHYVLYAYPVIWHLVSNEELEERYLISRYFYNLTQKYIEKDFKLYAGHGPAISQPALHNDKVKFFYYI